jgi:DNA-binding IclR family transcriptional regulator
VGLQPSAPALRLIDVVEFLAAHAGDELTATEIARGTGVNRTTCTSLLLALEARGWVHARSGTYSLGAGMIPLGEAALAGLQLADAVQPELDALVAELGLEALASVVSGTDLVVVAHARGDRVLSNTVRVGQTIPFVPPFGIAHLVHSDESRLDAWLSRARVPLDEDERSDFRTLVALAERRGYVIVLDVESRRRFEQVMRELKDRPFSRAARRRRTDLLAALARDEHELGPQAGADTTEVSQISAPVFGAGGTPVMALGVHAFPHQIEPSRIPDYTARVVGAAARVTERIHGVPPPSADA